MAVYVLLRCRHAFADASGSPVVAVNHLLAEGLSERPHGMFGASSL
jgi:hypothetical protein